MSSEFDKHLDLLQKAILSVLNPNSDISFNSEEKSELRYIYNKMKNKDEK